MPSDRESTRSSVSPPEGTDWLERYRGLDLESLRLLAANEGRPVRVITPQDEAITLDYRRERLNIWLTETGQVKELFAG
jgi:Peptidase inhibitor I78 family